MKMQIALDPGATMPTRSHEFDGGLDLYAMTDVWVRPCSMEIFDTGVHVAIPKGYVGLVKSRSGLMAKNSVKTDGTIDCGYTGSIDIMLFNHGRADLFVRKGERIGQLVIVPCLLPELEEVEKLDATERGENGLGSTGK